MTARTLFDKVWDAHAVVADGDGPTLLYVDLHLVHEVTSPQAFEGLRLSGRTVRRPDQTVATMDHNVPTVDQLLPIKDQVSAAQVEALRRNCAAFGITCYGVGHRWQGIVHVIGPELGLTLPGTTIVCGDSHTATHGAFGALAFGIGTTDVEHVLATQTLRAARPQPMEVRIDGELPLGVTAKDVALGVVRAIGTAGAQGHVVEYTGSAVRAMTMEQRMTLCNLTIEAGGRAGMIAPDETTIAYLIGRPFTPDGAAWDEAVTAWSRLTTDPGATYARTVAIDVAGVAPSVTWGTTPAQSVAVTDCIPDPDSFATAAERESAARALEYMGLRPGTPMQDVAIDTVFIGSCTNARIEDLRSAALIMDGRRVAAGVRVLVVPGSQQVKRQAEREGLDAIFSSAGAEWRDAGCSMCLGMNPDILQPGQRCASTSNRNFEGRQGRGGRTHLLSPPMAAAAAIEGRITDVRRFTAPLAEAVSMKPFRCEHGTLVPLDRSDVDTDQVIPKQFLKRIERSGYGAFLFHEWRYDESGAERAGFVLNQPAYRGGTVLVAGRNFGCGSSREHAVWALQDHGFRAVIAPSFADIFHGNALSCGLLPVTLADHEVRALLDLAAEDPGIECVVDLEDGTVTAGDLRFDFRLDPTQRRLLLDGLDDITLTLHTLDEISAFEATRPSWMPDLSRVEQPA